MQIVKLDGKLQYDAGPLLTDETANLTALLHGPHGTRLPVPFSKDAARSGGTTEDCSATSKQGSGARKIVSAAAVAAKKQQQIVDKWLTEAAAGKLGSGSVPGFVFFASRKTVAECLERKLFGLPAKKIEDVYSISRDTVSVARIGLSTAGEGRALRANPRACGQVVLLFNFSSRELHGLFRMAETTGGQPVSGLNLDPEAWAVDDRSSGR
eukprot:SAG31_NODE_650_length_13187_cov_3.011843_11_plen_211_part_00